MSLSADNSLHRRLRGLTRHLGSGGVPHDRGPLAAAWCASTTPNMKIAAVEVIYTKPAWVFVKITTDTGLVGWGEASYGGRDRATGVAVEEASRYLIGTCVFTTRLVHGPEGLCLMLSHHLDGATRLISCVCAASAQRSDGAGAAHAALVSWPISPWWAGAHERVCWHRYGTLYVLSF